MFFTKLSILLSICCTSIAAPILDIRDAPVQAQAVTRINAPRGALTVRQTGTRPTEFANITAAINSLSGTANATIFIYPGTYNEQLNITYKGPLTLLGYTKDISDYQNNQVNVVVNIASSVVGALDLSSTIRAYGNDFTMYNINARNTYGVGSPALALFARGERQAYYGCGFWGQQDTLEAHSLHQYYKKCYIEGNTDFIFGSASAWFEQCTIATLGGPISANGRASQSDPSWFVFNQCSIAAKNSTIAASSAYLGRPWGLAARVIYQFCTISNVINPVGWVPMAKGAVPTFEEYQNTGPGANTTKRQLTTQSTAAITLTGLLGANYQSWVNGTY